MDKAYNNFFKGCQLGKQVGYPKYKCKHDHNQSFTSKNNGAPRGRMNCTDIESCIRETMQIPRGERYELCRSVHAEANAIIAAARENMLGSTLYMCCTDPNTGEVVGSICSCAMCKRLIINAGITEVITREDKDNFTIHSVSNWIANDDSLNGTRGY